VLNETKTKIVVLGDLCLDLFMQVPFYPEKGGDGIGQSWLKQSGGSASNTAVALAHLGYAPHFFTHTGDDLWAQQLLATLSQEGVNISNIVKEEQDSVGITFLAVTPDGERTMFTYRGANSRLQPNEITPEKMAGAAMLHLSGYACLTPHNRIPPGKPSKLLLSWESVYPWISDSIRLVLWAKNYSSCCLKFPCWYWVKPMPASSPAHLRLLKLSSFSSIMGSVWSRSSLANTAVS